MQFLGQSLAIDNVEGHPLNAFRGSSKMNKFFTLLSIGEYMTLIIRLYYQDAITPQGFAPFMMKKEHPS